MRSSSPHRFSSLSVPNSYKTSPNSSSQRSFSMPYNSSNRSTGSHKNTSKSSPNHNSENEPLHQHENKVQLPPTYSSSKSTKKSTPEARIKRGECPKCGQKTHSINWRKKKTPLTIEGIVLKGVCLKCNFVHGYTRNSETGMMADDYFPMPNSNSGNQSFQKQHGLINSGTSSSNIQHQAFVEKAPPIAELEVKDDATHQVSVITNDPDILSFDGGLVTLTGSEKSSDVFQLGSNNVLGINKRHARESQQSNRLMNHAAAKKLLPQHSLASLYGTQQQQLRSSPLPIDSSNELELNNTVNAENETSLKPLSVTDAMRRGMIMAEDADESVTPPVQSAMLPQHLQQSVAPTPYYNQQQVHYFMQTQQQHQELLRTQQLDQMYHWNSRHYHAVNGFQLPNDFENDLDSLEYSKSSYSGSHHLVNMQHKHSNGNYLQENSNATSHYDTNSQIFQTNFHRKVGGTKLKPLIPSSMMVTPNTIMEEEFFMPSSSPPSSKRSTPISFHTEDDEFYLQDQYQIFNRDNSAQLGENKMFENVRARTLTHPAPTTSRLRVDSSEFVSLKSSDFRDRFVSSPQNDPSWSQKKRQNKEHQTTVGQPRSICRNVRFHEIKEEAPSRNSVSLCEVDNTTVSSTSLEGKEVIQQLKQQDLRMENRSNFDENKHWNDDINTRDSKSYANQIIINLDNEVPFDEGLDIAVDNSLDISKAYEHKYNHNNHFVPTSYDPFDISKENDVIFQEIGMAEIRNASHYNIGPKHFFPEAAAEEFKDEFIDDGNKLKKLDYMRGGELLPSATASTTKRSDEEYDDMKERVLQIFEMSSVEGSDMLLDLITNYKADIAKISLLIDIVRTQMILHSSSYDGLKFLFPIMIHTIVECMWEHCASSSMQISCCFFVWTISSLFSVNQDIAMMQTVKISGTIEAILVCSMEMHRTDANVQLYACGALTSLAFQDVPNCANNINDSTEENMISVISVGTMVNILNVMDTHPSIALVQEFSIRAIYAMCVGVNLVKRSLPDPQNQQTSPNYIMDFIQKGGIALLKKAMENHMECNSLIEWSCRLLSCLCRNSTIGKVILSSGIIVTVWNFIKTISFDESNFLQNQNFKEVVGLFSLSSRSLLDLFSIDSAFELVSGLWDEIMNYFIHLICIVGKTTFSEVILEYSLYTLSCIMPHKATQHNETLNSQPNNSTNLTSLLDTLFKSVLRNYQKNEIIQESSFKIVHILMVNKIICEKSYILHVAEYLPILVRSLQERSNSKKVLEPIIAILTFLCIDHERHSSLLSLNFLTVLVNVMENHTHAREIQFLSASAIYNLSVCSRHTEKMIESGVINALIQGMNNHIKYKELQEILCSTLYFLSSVDESINQDNHDQNAAIIIQAGGVKAVLLSMQEHSEYIPIQTLSCAILWNLSFSSLLQSSMQTIISRNDFILRSSSNSVSSHHDEDHKTLLAYNGGIDTIVFAILNFPNEWTLLEHALGALSSLVLSRDTARLFTSSGYVDVLIQALKRVTNVKLVGADLSCKVSILKNSFLLLRNLITISPPLSDTSILSPSSTSLVIEIIVNAINEYPDSLGHFIQREACGALFALSVLSEDNKALVVSSGGVDAMMNALDRNDCSLDVKETKMALVHLMTW